MEAFEVDSPEELKANMKLQSELIHVMWGYHADRLSKGHPFAIGNPIENITHADLRGFTAPYFLTGHIALHGKRPLRLIERTREKQAVSPVGIIRDGVIASVWDSLGHIIDLDRRSADPVYAPLFHDPDLLLLRSEMDRPDLSSYRGETSIHSGVQVGLGIIADLCAVKYGLPEGQTYDQGRIAHALAKADAISLTTLRMRLLTIRYAGKPEKMNELVQPDSALGMPASTLTAHCNPRAIGCAARLPASERALSILGRYGLGKEHEGKEETSAIMMMTERMQGYFKQQMDGLFAALTQEEQAAHISKGDLVLMGK